MKGKVSSFQLKNKFECFFKVWDIKMTREAVKRALDFAACCVFSSVDHQSYKNLRENPQPLTLDEFRDCAVEVLGGTIAIFAAKEGLQKITEKEVDMSLASSDHTKRNIEKLDEFLKKLKVDLSLENKIEFFQSCLLQPGEVLENNNGIAKVKAECQDKTIIYEGIVLMEKDLSEGSLVNVHFALGVPTDKKTVDKIINMQDNDQELKEFQEKFLKDNVEIKSDFRNFCGVLNLTEKTQADQQEK
jgi:hypothetical protein